MRLTDEPTGIVVFRHDNRAVPQPLALPQVSGPHPTIVHHSSQFRQILASVDPFSAGGKIGSEAHCPRGGCLAPKRLNQQ